MRTAKNCVKFLPGYCLQAHFYIYSESDISGNLAGKRGGSFSQKNETANPAQLS